MFQIHSYKLISECYNVATGSWIGSGTGNPGVFQGYPYPNPSLPVPSLWGTGFGGYGLRVWTRATTKPNNNNLDNSESLRLGVSDAYCPWYVFFIALHIYFTNIPLDYNKCHNERRMCKGGSVNDSMVRQMNPNELKWLVWAIAWGTHFFYSMYFLHH